MLSDKEKMILHFSCMITIARLTGVRKPDKLIEKMIEEVRRNRCRSIAPEDMEDLIAEIDEEMVSGKVLIKELMNETVWSMTGQRPDERPKDWRDMK